MPRAQIAIRIRSPALFRRAVAPCEQSRNILSVGNGGLLEFLIRCEMGIEGAMCKASGLHHFAHGHVLKSPFSKEARGLLHNPVMFCGGLFGGVPHFPASSIY